jgi:coenzyme F420-reducing hydrogenase gamma subunit
MQKKKLRVGWFTFTCCEDSTIIFTEMLNDNYKEWKNLIDFVHFKTIQDKNVWSEMDVAFVEGAISSTIQTEKLKRIRSLAKKVVAIGACACIAMPSGQRNQFDEATKAEIQFLLDRFKYSDKVQKLSDIVQVDDLVNGCPMNEQAFLTILNKYLKEFSII